MKLSVPIGPVDLAGARPSFHIYYGIAAGQEFVREIKGLVQITAGIVPEVEDQSGHPFREQFCRCRPHLLESGAGELGQADVSGSFVKHEPRVNAVKGNLGPHYLEGNHFPAAFHRYEHFSACRALYPGHDAVLREFYAGNNGVVHLKEAVAGLEAHFFRRPAGYYFKHDGSIGRHIELDADALEIAGKVLNRSLVVYGREIHGMRVQRSQGSRNGRIGHTCAVQGVHVVLLNHIEDYVKLCPVLIAGFYKLVVILYPDNGECAQHADKECQEQLDYLGDVSSFHYCSTCSTSIPARRRRSIPSVRRYASLNTTRRMPD